MAIWDWLISRPEAPGEERDDYRIVDVAGTWTRSIAGTSSFAEAVAALPLGPVEVTLRLQPKDSDPHGLAAYVDEQQVGWLATQRSGIESRLASGFLWRDPSVTWMTRLDAAGIRPRFQGLLRIAGDPGRRIINIDVPGRHEPRLSTLAKKIINAEPNTG